MTATAAKGGYHFPVAGEPLLGHEPGLRRRQLRELRSGKLHPETEIDLHGYRREAAQRALCEQLFEAHDSGAQCVLVIHGRGLRSESGGAVLKDALPGWLTTPPLAEIVRAFAPAQARDGGAGACYVLLR